MAENQESLTIEGSRPERKGKPNDPVKVYTERGVPIRNADGTNKTLSSDDLKGAAVTGYQPARQLVEVTKDGQTYLVRVDRLDFTGINEDEFGYMKLRDMLASQYPAPTRTYEPAAQTAAEQPVMLTPASAAPAVVVEPQTSEEAARAIERKRVAEEAQLMMTTVDKTIIDQFLSTGGSREPGITNKLTLLRDELGKMQPSAIIVQDLIDAIQDQAKKDDPKFLEKPIAQTLARIESELQQYPEIFPASAAAQPSQAQAPSGHSEETPSQPPVSVQTSEPAATSAKPAAKPVSYTAEQETLRGTVQGQLGLSKQGSLIVDSAAESAEANKVMIIQRALNDAKYDIGTYGAAKDGVDGKIGPKTTVALEAFAKENELSPEDLAEVLDKVVQSQGTETPLSLAEATAQFKQEKAAPQQGAAQGQAPVVGQAGSTQESAAVAAPQSSTEIAVFKPWELTNFDRDRKLINEQLKQQSFTADQIKKLDMDVGSRGADGKITAIDLDRDKDGDIDTDDVAAIKKLAQEAGIDPKVFDQITFTGNRTQDAAALGNLAALAVGAKPQQPEAGQTR